MITDGRWLGGATLLLINCRVCVCGICIFRNRASVYLNFSSESESQDLLLLSSCTRALLTHRTRETAAIVYLYIYIWNTPVGDVRDSQNIAPPNFLSRVLSLRAAMRNRPGKPEKKERPDKIKPCKICNFKTSFLAGKYCWSLPKSSRNLSFFRAPTASNFEKAGRKISSSTSREICLSADVMMSSIKRADGQ